MSELHLIFDLKGVSFNISLPHGVSIISGDSGIGKTFLFKTLVKYGVNPTNNCSVLHFDYSSYKQVNSVLQGGTDYYTIIIFDNADLYLNENMIKQAITLSDCVLIASREYCRAGAVRKHLLDISWSGADLTVTERGVL